MAQTVFWSWQSDRPARETRDVIRDALAAAIGELALDLEAAERPEAGELALDHDTKGLAGSPDITAAILEKIDSALAFVADVTPIGLSEAWEERRPKHIANPNVLIELGYAKKSLTADRVVQVWNSAFTNCTVDDLPFDMRGRRGPITFRLEKGASKAELKNAREYLTRELKGALGAILVQLPPLPIEPLPWKPSRPHDASVWFAAGEGILVNEDWSSGSIVFAEAPTRYVRMLPGEWRSEPSSVSHSVLLGHTMGYSWGQTRGGHLTYTGSLRVTGDQEHTQATLWFMDTGEVWAFDRFIVAEWQGRSTFLGDDLIKGWVSFIAAELKILLANGARLPIHLKVGVSGLLGSFWPIPNPVFGTGPQALEDAAEHEFTVLSDVPESWIPNMAAAWARLRAIYSMPPPTEAEVDAVFKSLPILRGPPS